jgi:hypothetical protein
MEDMTDVDARLGRLLGERTLQSRLNDIAHSKRVAGAAAAVYSKGAVFVAASASGAADESRGFTATTPVGCGCIAKTLTATLIARAAFEGKLELESSAAECLGVRELEGITVRHLLGHTHGLDGAAVAELPRHRDGFIDVEALCRPVLSQERLCAPGEIPNYGSIGSWLASAVVERRYARPYLTLLHENLLRYLPSWTSASGEIDAIVDEDVCPSMGHRLRLSARDFLQLLIHHLPVDGDDRQDVDLKRCYEALRADSLDLLAWRPRLKKRCLAWDDYGAGWFGESARLPRESATLRIHPAAGVAIVVTAASQGGADLVTSMLFSSVLPEYAEMRTPGAMDRGEWARVDASRYAGTYRNASIVAHVDVAANGSLRALVNPRNADSVGPDELAVKRYLRPARGDLFFPMPPEGNVIPCVRFHRADESGRFRYMHTGKHLLRRVSRPEPATVES